MGLKTYLGLNFLIEDLLIIHSSDLVVLQNEADNMAIDMVKSMQVATRFVYVIEMTGEFDNLNPQSKIETPVDYEAARKSLQNLHTILQENIASDDFAQVYFCWSEDEGEERLGQTEISLSKNEVGEVHSEERFLITFTN